MERYGIWGMQCIRKQYAAPVCRSRLYFIDPSNLFGIMPYPEALVTPMRQELVQLGVEELLDAEAVEKSLEESKQGTTLVVINTVCGCAASSARPAIAMALRHPVQPDRKVTVFAGQDLEATAHLREYLVGIPPSSPFFALLKEGEPVYVMERRHIEGRSASAIAGDLVHAFDTYCGDAQSDVAESPESVHSEGNGLPPTFRSIL